jgi:hypothetical protein
MLRTHLKIAVGLCVGLVLALTPASAEARFGKRSGGGGGGASSGSAAGMHGATGYSAGSRGFSYAPSYRYFLPYYYGFPSFYYGWGYGYYPYYGYYPPYYYDPYSYPYAPEISVGQQYRPELKVTLGAEGQAYSGGGSLAVNAGLEGRRFGIRGQFTGLSIKADDGTPTNDTIKLFDLFATYALIAHPSARFRVEAGLMSAFAPDLTAVGPGFGFSGSLRLLGPLGAEAAIHGTPYPYRELDWNAGIALGFGPLALRGGWRRVYLDDNGLVYKGVNQKDIFSGPYAGVGIIL